MTARIVLFFFCIGAFHGLNFSQAQDEATVPIPVGWDEMDDATKAKYTALWEDFRATKAALKLSDEEKAALSEAEKKAFYATFWETQASFREKLVAEGFEIESAFEAELADTVKKSAAKAAKPPAAEKVAATNNGTIQYDDGVLTGPVATGGNILVGNRFNTFEGNPVGSNGTVETVQAVVVRGPNATTGMTGMGAPLPPDAGFVIHQEQTVGGAAQAIFSTFTNAGPAMTQTLTFQGFSAPYMGSSFFVLFGNFTTVYQAGFGTGTTNGQGHHGAFGDTGGNGPNVTTITDSPSMNALVRATGNLLYDIPVELMKFEVESEKGSE